MSEEMRTDFLTPTTGFLMGMGSAMNIAGNYYRFSSSRTPSEADQRALRSDWMITGQDVAAAIDKADAEPECLTAS